LAPLPRWSAGIIAAPSLSGWPATAGVQAGVRVLGPVWVSATGLRDRGEWRGLLGVGVTF
jgi:hypothetical protein